MASRFRSEFGETSSHMPPLDQRCPRLTGRGLILQGVCKLPHQAHEVLSLAPLPGLEHGAADARAGGSNQIGQRCAFRADARLARAAVGSAVLAFCQSKTFELRNLTA